MFWELFDRHVGWQWEMPHPAANRRVEGIGHGDLLRQPGRFPLVYSEIVVPFLQSSGWPD